MVEDEHMVSTAELFKARWLSLYDNNEQIKRRHEILKVICLKHLALSPNIIRGTSDLLYLFGMYERRLLHLCHLPSRFIDIPKPFGI